MSDERKSLFPPLPPVDPEAYAELRDDLDAARAAAPQPDFRGTAWAGAEGRSIEEARAAAPPVCGHRIFDNLHECILPPGHDGPHRAAAPPVEPRMADSINGLDEIALVEAAENFLRWWRDGGRVGDTRDAIEPVIVAAARLAVRAAAPPVEYGTESETRHVNIHEAVPPSPDREAGLREAVTSALCQVQHSYHPETDAGPCHICRDRGPKIAALLASDKPDREAGA